MSLIIINRPSGDQLGRRAGRAAAFTLLVFIAGVGLNLILGSSLPTSVRFSVAGATGFLLGQALRPRKPA